MNTRHLLYGKIFKIEWFGKSGSDISTFKDKYYKCRYEIVE